MSVSKYFPRKIWVEVGPDTKVAVVPGGMVMRSSDGMVFVPCDARNRDCWIESNAVRMQSDSAA